MFCVGGDAANFKSLPTNADVLPRSRPRVHWAPRTLFFFSFHFLAFQQGVRRGEHAVEAAKGGRL